MIPRNQRNFGVFGLARRFSTIIFTVLGHRCVRMNKVGKFQKKKLWRSVGDGVIGNPSLGIPYHTCNATKVARETTVFFFFFLQRQGAITGAK